MKILIVPPKISAIDPPLDLVMGIIPEASLSVKQIFGKLDSGRDS